MADCAIDVDPIITTTHGLVRGKLRDTVYDDQYYCFDGIPYAKPPLGELRFRSPEPVEPWTGVRDCTEVAPKCTQYNKYTDHVEGSEDCLYLNIYAKKLKSEKPLPVMVMIHGGYFHTNTASRLAWGPDYFMMKDVILVTIAYRLGALGFLSFPEQELQVSGNAGLKDIVLALKWLKQNAHNFNGDPENVTLFGNSSGSAAVGILSMTPQCEGLFHKAIFQSGIHLNTPRVPNVTYRFTKHAGYDGPEDNEQMLNFLRSLEAEKLCDYNFWTQVEIDEGRNYHPFMPTEENPNVSDAIIPKNLLDMMSNKEVWSLNIPIMLGGCSFESLSDYYNACSKNPKYVSMLKDRPDLLNAMEVRLECDLDTQTKIMKKLVKLHMDDKELIFENVFDMCLLYSYGFIYHPMHRYLGPRLMHAKAPTYLYRFDYDSPDFNLYRIRLLGREIRGCCHCSELPYLYYIPQSFKLERDTDDFRMIELMIDLFTAFATNGDPNTDRLKPVIWEPISANETRKCLNISNENTFIDWPEYEKCKLRDQIYEEVGLRLF